MWRRRRGERQSGAGGQLSSSRCDALISSMSGLDPLHRTLTAAWKHIWRVGGVWGGSVSASPLCSACCCHAAAAGGAGGGAVPAASCRTLGVAAAGGRRQGGGSASETEARLFFLFCARGRCNGDRPSVLSIDSSQILSGGGNLLDSLFGTERHALSLKEKQCRRFFF